MTPDKTARCFTAPGRVEIGGNHTDHQHGRVLAAAINLKTTAAVKANDYGVARIDDAVFGREEVDLGSLDIREGEKGKPAAIVRGVAAWFIQHGYPVGGFDAIISSDVPFGAGLSSSAAFEVLIGNIFKGLYPVSTSASGSEGVCCSATGSICPGISRMEIAIAGQYAENVYFGKPCGLMDQTASSFGGLNAIDFADPINPQVVPVQADLAGYMLCIVNTGGSHADLTPDYAAIPGEMKAVAAHFGYTYLREVPPDVFYSSVESLRYLGDRAVLRAFHFFGENERVLKQSAALGRNDIAEFLSLINESGRSSLAYLQNVYSPAGPRSQGLTLALAMTEKKLKSKGACRVHGGGFAGTILAFVPEEIKTGYDAYMSGVFGDGCCHFLSISSEGGGEAT